MTFPLHEQQITNLTADYDMGLSWGQASTSQRMSAVRTAESFWQALPWREGLSPFGVSGNTDVFEALLGIFGGHARHIFEKGATWEEASQTDALFRYLDPYLRPRREQRTQTAGKIKYRRQPASASPTPTPSGGASLQEVADLIEQHRAQSAAHHAPGTGGTSAPAVAMRMGWSNERVFTADAFTAVGTSARTEQPPIIEGETSAYLAFWLPTDAEVLDVWADIENSLAVYSMFFPVLHREALTVDGTAGFYYASNVQFTEGLAVPGQGAQISWGSSTPREHVWRVILSDTGTGTATAKQDALPALTRGQIWAGDADGNPVATTPAAGGGFSPTNLIDLSLTVSYNVWSAFTPATIPDSARYLLIEGIGQADAFMVRLPASRPSLSYSLTAYRTDAIFNTLNLEYSARGFRFQVMEVELGTPITRGLNAAVTDVRVDWI